MSKPKAPKFDPVTAEVARQRTWVPDPDGSRVMCGQRYRQATELDMALLSLRCEWAGAGGPPPEQVAAIKRRFAGQANHVAERANHVAEAEKEAA